MNNKKGGRRIASTKGKWQGKRNRGITTSEDARQSFDSFYSGNPLGKKYHMKYKKKTRIDSVSL